VFDFKIFKILNMKGVMVSMCSTKSLLLSFSKINYDVKLRINVHVIIFLVKDKLKYNLYLNNYVP
jgi:hypothetical protein